MITINKSSHTGITEARVWILERRVFQKIMVRSGRQEQEDNIRFLKSVPLLQGIDEIELAHISDFLKRVSIYFARLASI